jgi:beta-glucosidase
MKDFIFGAATSAYQIEGAWDEDGKLPSIWDEISHGHSRTKVRNGHTGDTACDHYHKWKKDVKLMKELGIDAYRFSISWSRIMPPSATEINWKGLDFYKNLVYELQKNDIEPFVTLYHWDLPKWLDDLGGWSEPHIVNHFKGFACMMFEALPTVKYWITFNEPAVFVNNFWGHNNYSEAVRNVLLAHGEAVRAFRRAKMKGKIGISLNLIPVVPYTKRKKDEMAAGNISKLHNEIWLDPIYRGRFPKDINELIGYEDERLVFSKEESNIVSIPIDFLGINYYTSNIIRYDEDRPPTFARGVPNDAAKKDEMDTSIIPYGIYNLTSDIAKRYGNPDMYITENGCAYTDGFTHDKKIHDYRRIDYMKRHLKWCEMVVEKGVNLKGYFHWSLLDNFEWTFGYTKRFGLVYIHYPTLERIPKDSFYWYHDYIEKERKNE